jgi:CheY-like chemotaxis protein
MKRVLVVEDEPAIRALIAACLENGDCAVDAVADGNVALESVSRATPDLILLDVGLPGMSGDELLRRLRSDEATADIPILMLTGLDLPEGADPDGVLLKPFTPAVLRESVSTWLS